MKKYISMIVTAIIIAALAVILLSTEFDSVYTLLRPPKNKGQNSEIQSAFESSLNDKYILRSPLSGEYKSSFILVDFDNDKDDEVVVFYSLSGTPDVVRMNILDNIDGEWKSIADFESAHKQVHKVAFSDIDKDGAKEIIVGWSLSDIELNNTINVYRICSDESGSFAEKIFENNYSEFTVCDVNSDFKSDILLFDKFHADTTSIRVTYFDFDDSGYRASGEFFIDPVISSVNAISYDKDKSNGNTRFYVDGYRVDNGMTTDFFYWDNKSRCFKYPDFNNPESVSTAATRSTSIICSDVNDDAVIEIPFEEYISESVVVSSAKALEKQQSIIKWMKCTDYGLSPVYYEIFIQNNCSLKIKNEWFGKFTVKNEPENGKLTFYALDDYSAFGPDDKQKKEDDIFDFRFGNEEEKDGDLALFSILAVAENETDFSDLTGYKFLKSDDSFNYYCYIYKEGKERDISKDSLKKVLVTRGDNK